MYLRFIIAEIGQDSGQELGIFHAFQSLLDNHQLHPHEQKQYDSIILWFGQHLKKPGRFTASKPPFWRKKKKAISWFKDSAHEHLSRIRELVVILEQHGKS